MAEVYSLDDFTPRRRQEPLPVGIQTGCLIYLNPQERLEAAARDEELLAFCELKENSFTDVKIPESRIDFLSAYTLSGMLDDLRIKHGITDRLAALALIREMRYEIREREEMKAPHAY